MLCFRIALYSNGQVINLGTLGGAGRLQNINNTGQVVGLAASEGISHVFLYSNGQMVDLGLGAARVELVPLTMQGK